MGMGASFKKLKVPPIKDEFSITGVYVWLSTVFDFCYATNQPALLYLSSLIVHRFVQSRRYPKTKREMQEDKAELVMLRRDNTFKVKTIPQIKIEFTIQVGLTFIRESLSMLVILSSYVINSLML